MIKKHAPNYFSDLQQQSIFTVQHQCKTFVVYSDPYSQNVTLEVLGYLESDQAEGIVNNRAQRDVLTQDQEDVVYDRAYGEYAIIAQGEKFS